MRGLLMRRRGGDDSDDDDELPWDPIWEFLLGDDDSEDDEYDTMVSSTDRQFRPLASLPSSRRQSAANDDDDTGDGLFGAMFPTTPGSSDPQSSSRDTSRRWQLPRSPSGGDSVGKSPAPPPPPRSKTGAKEEHQEEESSLRSLIGWPTTTGGGPKPRGDNDTIESKTSAQQQQQQREVWALDFSAFGGSSSWTLGSDDYNHNNEPTKKADNVKKKNAEKVSILLPKVTTSDKKNKPPSSAMNNNTTTKRSVAAVERRDNASDRRSNSSSSSRNDRRSSPRRFSFGFGNNHNSKRHRAFNGHASAPPTTTTEIFKNDPRSSQSSSKRSFFPRSTSAPVAAAGAVSIVGFAATLSSSKPTQQRKKTSLLSRRPMLLRRKSRKDGTSASGSSYGQAMEVASIELSKGLDTISRSSSKLLEWSGLDKDESSEEIEQRQEKASAREVKKHTVPKATKPQPQRQPATSSSPSSEDKKRDGTKYSSRGKYDYKDDLEEEEENNTSLTGSFQALMDWMDGSDTEKDSIGTSEFESSTLDESNGTTDDTGGGQSSSCGLDESNGTHSCDHTGGPTLSLDGDDDVDVDEDDSETQSLQLSSQITESDDCDESDNSAGEAEQSQEEESYDSDEETGSDEPTTNDEESSEDRDHPAKRGPDSAYHDFFAEEKLTEFDRRRVSQGERSAFSSPGIGEGTTSILTTSRKPNTANPEQRSRGVLQAAASPPHHQPQQITRPTVRQVEETLAQQNSIIDETAKGEEDQASAPRSSPRSQARPRGSILRVGRLSRNIGAYLPSRSMTPQQKYMSTQKGVVPHHELSPQELAELFPKVRSICDDSSAASSFFADQTEFDQSKPAHLQASIPRRGPQSLFEYEYETGVHMYAAYTELGSEATCPMRVRTTRVPLPVDMPKSREKNIIVQVEASTVSQTDCSIREGDWWGEDPLSLPNSPGVDVVGRIFCLDPETKRKTGFMKGERVMSLVQWGGNSRFISLDPTKLVKLPEYVDPAMAACLAETYLTAFQVLHIDMPCDLRYEILSLNGTRTLIIGKAITNLGRAISDLGKIAGGKVYALAKERHFAKVSAIGIRPRDVDSLDWWDELDGKVDTIVCIDQDVATIYYKLLKSSGRVVMVRSATSGDIQIEPKKKSSDLDTHNNKSRKQLYRSRSQRSQPEQHQSPPAADATKVYDVFAEWKTNLDLCKDDLHHLVDLLVRKEIQPKVLDRISLNRVGQAQQMINGRSIKGYIVCEPWLVAKSRAIAL